MRAWRKPQPLHTQLLNSNSLQAYGFDLEDYVNTIAGPEKMWPNGLRLLSVISGLNAIKKTELDVRISEGRAVVTLNLFSIVPVVVAASLSIPMIALGLWMRLQAHIINILLTYSQAMAKIKHLQQGGKCNFLFEGDVETCIAEEGGVQHFPFKEGIPTKRDETKRILIQRRSESKIGHEKCSICQILNMFLQ